jgi:ribosomal protein L11 methylase PrmA
MTTDPGDIVLDPTCGSGTTAYVAEKWGRRWITCDTSRVAITLAKQRTSALQRQLTQVDLWLQGKPHLLATAEEALAVQELVEAMLVGKR